MNLDPTKADLGTAVKLTQPFGAEVPFWLGRCAARVPDFRGTSATPAGLIVGGAGGFDPDSVRIRAFGELIERSCAFRAREIVATVRHRYDPASSLPKDDVAGTIWPEPSEVCSWVRAFHLPGLQIAEAPALLAFLQWVPPAGEVPFCRPSATGLAAGVEDRQAIDNALLEIVERDAAACSWFLPNYPAAPLDVAMLAPRLTELAAAASIEMIAVDISQCRSLPVVLCLCRSVDDDGWSVGTACCLNLADALSKAAGEALVMQISARAPIARAAHPKSSLGRAYWVLKNGKDVRNWYRSLESKQHKKKNIEASPQTQLASWVSMYFESGVLGIDLTDERLVGSKWRCWRVVVPGAADPALSFSSGGPIHRRLRQESLSLGGNGPRNTLPHPFS
jgi:ribosomal protein S12 methylthiotransferase accessory factor YcaO